LISWERFDQPAQGPIVEMMQNSNQLAIRLFVWREPWSVFDPQRPDVCVAELPREPPVFVAVASVDTALIHLFRPPTASLVEAAIWVLHWRGTPS
jgi:hypothetical protein